MQLTSAKWGSDFGLYLENLQWKDPVYIYRYLLKISILCVILATYRTTKHTNSLIKFSLLKLYPTYMESPLNNQLYVTPYNIGPR